MNFLGMGPMEIAVILIVALLIFGPGKLPELAGQAGKMMRDFKKMTADLSDEFEKTAGLDEIKKTVQKEMAGIQNEVSGVTSGVKKELTSASSTVKGATSTAKKPATSKASTANKSTTASKTTSSSSSKTGAAAKSTSTTASKTTTTPAKVAPPKASKADPFADVSFLEDGFDPAPVNTTTRPTAAKAAATTPSKPAASASSEPAPEVSDALARARARRQQAGYNRAHL